MARSARKIATKVAELVDYAGSEAPNDAALTAIVGEDLEQEGKTQRKGTADATLSRYFQEMSRHPLLRPAEELAMAQEVEDLERKYWVELFSYAPAYATVASVVRTFVPDLEELKKLDKMAACGLGTHPSKRDEERRLIWETAVKLRDLDKDRAFVQSAYEAVQRLAGRHVIERDLIGENVQLTSAFRRYIARVEDARREQQRAKNQFVAANLRLVIAIARRHKRGNMPLIDLIQEGNIGLMKAVERFDHARGYRFSTYASWWIRHGISRALADKARVVRIPVHMIDTLNSVRRATKTVSSRTGREPTTEELAQETGIAEGKLEKMRAYWPESPFSLDRPVNDEDERTFVDFLESENTPSPHEELVTRTWASEVERLLAVLSPMEARVLKWRFGLDDEEEHSLQEIGDKHNLSRERIRQVQERALDKIRRQMND